MIKKTNLNDTMMYKSVAKTIVKPDKQLLSSSILSAVSA